MKVMITTTEIERGLDSPFESRFGRAPYFVIVDSDTKAWQVYANPALRAGGGAGTQAAQFIADQEAEVAISGDFGPKAYKTLAAAGIKMFLGPTGENLTARDLLDRYRSGQLKAKNDG